MIGKAIPGSPVTFGEEVAFSKPKWLAPHHVEDRFAAVLPKGVTR
jgi:hypothetical protein